MEEIRNKQGQTLSEFLAAYDENRYRHPSVTVDMAVFTLLKEPELSLGVLLIKRGNHPNLGKWALPGGFVEIDEDLPVAAARELEEETGLTGLPLRPFGTFGAVDRDPRTRVITTGFYAVAPAGSLDPEAGDDAAEAGMFRIKLHRTAHSAPADTYALTLSGPETLYEQAQLRYDELGALPAALPGGDLASDHGHVLFSALYALGCQPARRVARLLALNDPELLLPAEELIANLFPKGI
ncbi:MAG: NUDIX hydrolase [Clostridia bacterium]|nr:NUDIX hydrolase [Clostridia bacterium]MBR0026054.1 NUDIX hydrolase [Clostridia bacterium]